MPPPVHTQFCHPRIAGYTREAHAAIVGSADTFYGRQLSEAAAEKQRLESDLAARDADIAELTQKLTELTVRELKQSPLDSSPVGRWKRRHCNAMEADSPYSARCTPTGSTERDEETEDEHDDGWGWYALAEWKMKSENMRRRFEEQDLRQREEELTATETTRQNELASLRMKVAEMEVDLKEASATMVVLQHRLSRSEEGEMQPETAEIGDHEQSPQEVKMARPLALDMQAVRDGSASTEPHPVPLMMPKQRKRSLRCQFDGSTCIAIDGSSSDWTLLVDPPGSPAA